MKKSSLTIIVVLCCALSGVCQQVTIQEATNAAVNTMRYYGRNNISNSSIDSVYSMVNQGDTLLYEVHFESGETVLLSGHKACEPVLGYITEGKGETILNRYDQIPDGLRDFVDEYAAYSQYFFDTVSELIHLSDWEALQTYDRDMEIHRVVGPLTQSAWGQDETYIKYWYFDEYFFYEDSTLAVENDIRAYNYKINAECDACSPAIYSPAGCSAVAMAQIMYYWKYPVFMEDSTKQYDWCNMTDILGDFSSLGIVEPEYLSTLYETYYSQREAIAILIRDCAEMAHTKYCANNQCQASSGPVRTKNAFKDFGYNDVTLKWRMFNLRTWKDLLKADLNNGYPICYSSGDVLALEGHTYVCDGYNDDNKFSFNWGWNGDCNGYFYPLDSLENMNDFHSAIFNIVPDDDDYYCDFTSNLYNYYLNHTDKIPYEITPRTFTRLESVTQTEDATGYYRTIPQNARAEYTAHKTVLLRDGFHAEAGSEFRAYINPCGPCETSLRSGDESYEKPANKMLFDPIESQIETHQLSKGISVYPNPNKGKFHVGLNDKQDIIKQITLYGILGNQIMTDKHPQSGVIDLSHVPAGVYIVKVLTVAGSNYFEKVVKE